ncbi:MAG: exodeoxyribonuclease VII large subunit [Firmicutes bacterium]|nr:exodeoxyribonuclease VII large subunit [Bacillota bacterium]MCL1953394.1 exodeoxyribonuclease VII large subunit [Bacillota bacterium]
MKTYTISQLNSYIKNVFDDEFVLNNIQLIGEVADCNLAKGNLFFTLTDETNSIDCVQFGGPENFDIGETLTVVGSVRFYVKSGQVRLIAYSVSKANKIGTKQLAYLALKNKLQELGYLDNRLELPDSVHKIALVTSIEGAVVHDFVSVARDRNLSVDIVVYSVRVQGEESAIEIKTAFDAIHRMPILPDVIVLARGGGSNLDLDSFNNEIVVMSVAQSKIPVVSAIGHENDYTLCDLCASLRAGTPSIAAQMIVPDNNATISCIKNLLQDIQDLMQNIFYRMYNKLTYLLQAIVYNCSNQINGLIVDIKYELEQIATISQLVCDREIVNLNQLTTKLDYSSPTKLLLQGYAKLRVDNKNVRSISQIENGQDVQVYLHDGNFKATVAEIFESI